MQVEYICTKCNSKYFGGKRLNEQRRRLYLPEYCPSCMKEYKSKKLSTGIKNAYATHPEYAEKISKKAKLRYELKSDEEKRMIADNLKFLRDDFWNNASDTIKKDIYNRASNTNKEIWKDPNKRKLQSEKLSSYWKNLDPKRFEELKMLNSRGQIRHWKSLSDEDKKIKVAQLNNGFAKYWANLSEEDIEKYRNECKDRYHNLSDEEKEKWAERCGAWWINLSDEGKAAYSQYHKELYNNLSDEEKAEWAQRSRNAWNDAIIRNKIINRMKNSWNNLSKEERTERIKNAKEGLRLFWKNITQDQYLNWLMSHSTWNFSDMTSSESEFINILNIEKIYNEYQWVNKIKHPDFDKLFPYNPITNTSCSPFHKWDFMIISNGNKILIDIDGSIHTLQPNKWIDNGIDIGKYIQFNDSKRPYQTDGLYAYVIMCYNDKLDNDTPVLSFNSGEIMTFNQFMEIIRPIDKTSRIQFIC